MPRENFCCQNLIDVNKIVDIQNSTVKHIIKNHYVTTFLFSNYMNNSEKNLVLEWVCFWCNLGRQKSLIVKTGWVVNPERLILYNFDTLFKQKRLHKYIVFFIKLFNVIIILNFLRNWIIILNFYVFLRKSTRERCRTRCGGILSLAFPGSRIWESGRP